MEILVVGLIIAVHVVLKFAVSAESKNYQSSCTTRVRVCDGTDASDALSS